MWCEWEFHLRLRCFQCSRDDFKRVIVQYNPGVNIFAPETLTVGCVSCRAMVLVTCALRFPSYFTSRDLHVTLT